MWWPGTELNRRRQPFQGCALPPELPGHVSKPASPRRLRGNLLRASVGGIADKLLLARNFRTPSIIATAHESLNVRSAPDRRFNFLTIDNDDGGPYGGTRFFGASMHLMQQSLLITIFGRQEPRLHQQRAKQSRPQAVISHRVQS